MSIAIKSQSKAKTTSTAHFQIVNGDCIEVMADLTESCIDMVLTDPPYLTRYRDRHGRTVMHDDNSWWVEAAFTEIYRVLKPDSFCITFYGWPHVDIFMAAWKKAGFRPVGHISWVKDYCSRTGYVRGFHEVGFVLAKGRPARPENPVNDVLNWDNTGNKLHPTQKPLRALAPLINAYSNPGDMVLDPFCGSGSTAVAALKLGRSCIGIEKDIRHFETAKRRLGVANDNQPVGVSPSA